MIFDNFVQFLIQWGITSISLWVVSHIFSGIKFSSTSSLVVSALLLGFANAVLRPLLLILTFPLTLITLGLFVLVINALMLQLVSSLVKGFTVSGFWTAFWASIFISVMSLGLGSMVPDNEVSIYRLPVNEGLTISM